GNPETPSQPGGDPQHHPTHDSDAHRGRHFLPDLGLRRREIDYVELYRACAVSAEHLCQVDHFLFGAIAREWEAMKVNRLKLDPPLHRQPTRDWRVDSSREKQQSLAARSDRKSSGSCKALGIDVDRFLAHFQVEDEVGSVHVDFEPCGKCPQEISPEQAV